MASGSALWLRRCRGGGAKLLIIGGDRRDLLIVELLSEERHRLGTVLAEAALPHLQFECCVMRVLSGEVRDRWRLANAAHAMTDVTGGNSFHRITRLGQLLTLSDEGGICAHQRRERSFNVCIVRGNVIDIVWRQRAGDRGHDGVCSHARAELSQLLRKVGCRLTGNSRKRATAIRAAGEGMA